MTVSLDHVTVAVNDGPDRLTILDDLSLAVGAGEVIALTGESGSGKSTLLAVAGLLRRPDAGTVRVAGTDASGLSRKALTRLRGTSIGFVFQTANLFPSLTALEQVELVAHMAGRLDGAARERARELLVGVGLEGRLVHRPAQLSGGERQRVGIARALMNEPAVLLADEPTAALDDARGREITALLLAQAAERQVATLIVTHNPAQLPAGTRRLALAGGRVADVAPSAA
ncbi:MAG: ABC transporter ATP-binding protein [Actinobacteria bacterium]|nr:ABC transporter ATP-binding protein [Actinomycetota bacterium]